MSRITSTFAVLAVLAVSAFMLSACSSGATARGTSYSYEFATLKAHLPHHLDDVYRATERTLNNLELEIESSSKDAFEARIIARGVRNLRHAIDLRRDGDTVTSVSISVGALGDETRSREIMSMIEERLAPQE